MFTIDGHPASFIVQSKETGHLAHCSEKRCKLGIQRSWIMPDNDTTGSCHKRLTEHMYEMFWIFSLTVWADEP